MSLLMVTVCGAVEWTASSLNAVSVTAYLSLSGVDNRVINLRLVSLVQGALPCAIVHDSCSITIRFIP